jgi:glycosyltransferase involved in cell wall biosynthesis
VIHDLCPLSIPQLNPIKLKASFFAGLQTLRLADHVVTDSQYTRDDLTAMNLLPRWRTSVAFCGPGVLPSDKEPNYARRFVPFVLYVGSHAPHKNVARLIHAFARVRASRKLKLVLVGPGSKEQLHRMARIVGLNNLHSRVVHLPTMSDPQMSSLYRHCQLLACPSLYEGFGLPVLEAMLHGAPVACSNASSLPEVAGQAAILFNPFSTTDIANQLQTVLDSPGLASQLSEAGRDRALLFNWERTASSILARAAELT